MSFKTGILRKQRVPNFPKNEHFSPAFSHTYMCVSGVKKCSFFGKFDELCFFETWNIRFEICPSIWWPVKCFPYFQRMFKSIFISKFCRWRFILDCFGQINYHQQLFHIWFCNENSSDEPYTESKEDWKSSKQKWSKSYCSRIPKLRCL